MKHCETESGIRIPLLIQRNMRRLFIEGHEVNAWHFRGKVPRNKILIVVCPNKVEIGDEEKDPISIYRIWPGDQPDLDTPKPATKKRQPRLADSLGISEVIYPRH